MNSKNEKLICDILGIDSIAYARIFPLYFQIETTSKCNSKCNMCPRSKTDPIRTSSSMPEEMRKKILADLAPFKDRIRRVVPQGYGEPLLDRELPDFVRRLKEIGIAEVFISTNASLLKEEIARELLAAGIDQLDLSVDAVTPETYSVIRKGLDYEEVVDNITEFIKLRNSLKSPARVRFRYVIQEINKDEYKPFVEFWKQRIGPDDIIYAKKVHTFGTNIERPKTPEYLELEKRLIHEPCKSFFGSMAILSDGNVPICGVDVNQKFTAGNIMDNTIQQIWQGKLFEEFRSRHLENGRASYPHCTRCNSWAPDLKLPEEQ